MPHRTPAENHRPGRRWAALSVAALGCLASAAAGASAGVAHANPGDDPRDCQASAWPPQGDASGQTSPWLPQGVLSGPRTDNNAGNCVFRITLPPP